jgi:hypothetical protein
MTIMRLVMAAMMATMAVAFSFPTAGLGIRSRYRQEHQRGDENSEEPFHECWNLYGVATGKFRARVDSSTIGLAPHSAVGEISRNLLGSFARAGDPTRLSTSPSWDNRFCEQAQSFLAHGGWLGRFFASSHSVPFRWLALPVAEGRVGATPEVINQQT